MPTSSAVPRRAVHHVLGSMTFLLVLSWLATPMLAYAAMIASAPFFGELPSPEEQATSTRLWLLAAFTGFVAPASAAILARRSRPVRLVALTELGISLAVVIGLMLATR